LNEKARWLARQAEDVRKAFSHLDKAATSTMSTAYWALDPDDKDHSYYTRVITMTIQNR
jgi:hypothetical protein